ncbi:MAG TPA: TIGR03435 family protein [Vicinamibacterales bacterium]|nr:TIGR03435 family protein [Vicinamibacterales bacterium]
MKRLLAVLTVLAISTDSLLGQASAPRPAFDIAGIQVSTRPNTGMRGGVLRGTRYELRNATMVDLIRTAYNVQAEKISGGPAWLEWNRFDIAALAPENTPPDRLREMLKTLLAERFKLAVREDVATTTAMALKIKGAHKMKESPGGGGGCQAQGAPEPNGVTAITATCNMTMAQFADQLPRAQSLYFPNGQQLIDETGLTGSFEFQVKFTPRQLLAQAGSDGVSLPAALEKIGLILEPKEMQVPAIVVDTASAEFTPNPADLATRMPPPPPPQFEVAVLKPSPPDAQNPRAQLQQTGVANISAAPLNRIMQLAWTLPNEQYIVGPKSLETIRIDITARAFATPNPENQAQVDEDLARLMLRSLLIDRFEIKWHMEDRPMPAYTLVAESPKMTKADPKVRTRCFEGAPPGSAAAAKPPQYPRQVTCQNVSMAQFGQMLPNVAGGYTRVPALDKTGLEGGYDFTLNFTPIEMLQGARPELGAANSGQALDPTGGLSLMDAVRRQLGVRLEETKRPVPVLVIDSMRETPKDN